MPLSESWTVRNSPPPASAACQRVDHDHNVRLRGLHGAFDKLQTFNARLAQYARLTGRDAHEARQRFIRARLQMARDDQTLHGLRADGVGRDVPVAQPDDERLPARPQQLAQRPAHGAHGI